MCVSIWARPVRSEGERRDLAAQREDSGLPAAQQLYIIDAVPAGSQRMDQGEELAAGVGRAPPAPQIEQLVGGLLDL